MKSYTDLYDVLNVSPDSKLEEIRVGYKKLARDYHPDSGTKADNEKFFEIQNAWEILSDTDKRSDYDKSRNKKGWNSVSKKNHSAVSEVKEKKSQQERAEERAAGIHGYGDAKSLEKTRKTNQKKPKRGDTGFLKKLKDLSEKE